MNITKKILCTLPYCYAVAATPGAVSTYLFATDAPGACVAVNSETLACDEVWQQPGGTMSLVPVPSREGEFLAVQNFMPGFQAQHAEIVWVRKAANGWEVLPFLKMPYIHRVDIVTRNGIAYLLCCVLCGEKQNEEDWHSPGHILAAELPQDASDPIELTRIADSMTRNHGYCRAERDGYQYALTACDQGVFELVPPEQRHAKWSVRCILERPVSDIALCDIDGDGVQELAAIEPFHGNRFSVYRLADGKTTTLYEYPANGSSFFHVAWGGMLRGKPVFLGGCRAGGCELFLLRWNGSGIEAEVIERGMGPSNAVVIPGPHEDRILVANREHGEAALFTVTDGPAL